MNGGEDETEEKEWEKKEKRRGREKIMGVEGCCDVYTRKTFGRE